ncbi:putative signal peptide-containing protein [Acinetobacter baumannii]|nr:putative signal peptide-containing protein [Acinetobacter baumannii]
MVRGIANSKIGFGDLILLLRYFFKLKVSTHPSKGGNDFIQLISQLNPQYIQISNELDFNAPASNSNHFYGHIRFSYTPPNGKLNEKESALFKQYGVIPCDYEKTLELHKFELNLRGTVYPPVNNLKKITPLSKPYHVRIQYLHDKSGKVPLSTKEKLASLPLLPFTLTFDIIALPAKVMGIIYQP